MLRCGVPAPTGRDAGPIRVNGKVSWRRHVEGDTVEWTTTDRTSYVEVAIPKHYGGSGDVLVALTEAVARTLPARRPAA